MKLALLLLTIRVEKGKGKGKWVRILIYIIYVHIRVATCLNEIKKGGETSKSILKRGIYIGMANMHKEQRRQDRDGLVMMAR